MVVTTLALLREEWFFKQLNDANIKLVALDTSNKKLN